MTPMTKDAVAAFVIVDGKALLIKRADGVRAHGYWSPVTGEVESGETQENAVVREMMEEVNLNANPVKKLREILIADGRFLLHWWLTEITGGEMRPNPAEAQEARFFTAEEIETLSPMFEESKQYILKYMQTK